MVNPETHKRIEDKILDVLLRAQEIYKQSFDVPQLVYKQMGRTAGKAWFSAWKIEINPDFLNNGHLSDMINVTVPHELAHLISRKVYGDLGAGHGRFWKSVMIRLGLRPDRCHDYSLEGVKTRRTKRTQTATCPTCGEQLMITPYRVRQIQNGAKVYCTKTMRCRYAKKTLQVG